MSTDSKIRHAVATALEEFLKEKGFFEINGTEMDIASVIRPNNTVIQARVKPLKGSFITRTVEIKISVPF